MHHTNRRDFLKAMSATAVSFAATKESLGAAGNAKRPNIVILESDQHAPDVMSCAGHRVIKTPHMDALAREGVMFTQAICPSPVCQPSRVALMTGRYPHQNGVYSNRCKPETPITEQWTFPRELRKAGYFTGFIGKTHLAQKAAKLDYDAPEFIGEMKRYGLDSVLSSLGKVSAGMGAKRDCPYTRHLKKKGLYEAFCADMRGRQGKKTKGGEKRPRWYSEPSPLSGDDFHDAWIGARAADWVRDYKEEKPFMLWVNWGGPHAPWDAPKPYHSMYDPRNVSLPYADPREGYPIGTYSKPSVEWSEDATRKVRANYYGLINVVDDAIGRIVEMLRQRGMLDNTIVIYCSDHGEMLGNHGRYAKGVMYRDSVGVPLIVSSPKRFVRNKKIDAPANTLDLIPTILEAAGLPVSKGVEGKSLIPILTGKTTQHTEAVFSEIRAGKQHHMMVRTERYKYVCCPDWERAKLPAGSNPAAEIKRLEEERRRYWAEAQKIMADEVPAYAQAKGKDRVPIFVKHRDRLLKTNPAFRRAFRAAKDRVAAKARLEGPPRAQALLFDLKNDPRELTNLSGKKEHADAEKRLRAMIDAWQAS